jgi:hypothetical protein
VQIVQPGGQLIPPRLRCDQIINPPKPLQPKRLKIIRNTAIRGVLFWPGSVVEFDTASEAREDFSLLLGSLKAERVPLSTPLFTAPEPALPPPLPAKQETPSMKDLIGALTTALKSSKA